jgi:hypothetical protein
MMPDPYAEKRKIMPPSKAKEALRRHQQDIRDRANAVREEKNARAQAGRTAVGARAKVDEWCSDVEATWDPERHRELLEQAVRVSSSGIGELSSAWATQNPSGWLAAMLSGCKAGALVTRARALRSDKDRFTDFLTVLARSLEDSGVGLPAIRYIEDEIAHLSTAEIRAPSELAGLCGSARRILDDEAQRLRDGGSLADAWIRARAAEDILDGAVVLLTPAMCEGQWLNDGASAGACLCVTAGAALMARGFSRMSAAVDPPETAAHF